jgi:hypothetical protein
MPIIIHSKDQNLDWARWNIYPDQFVPESEKSQDDWIKSNMDYFANVAYSQFIKGKDTFVNNYNLVKGILRPQDFYINDTDDPEFRSFSDTLVRDVELPSYVKHYPILNPPLNTMLGELSRRPDVARVKAFDDDSKNEELQFKTDILQQFIMENAKSKIMTQLGIQGEANMDPEQMEQLTMEKVSEYLTDYTSTAEKWGNHVLEAMKMQMNMKEISEDCFRDLLICSREFYHIYETHTKLGVAVENLNPKNVWYLTLPDKKYLKDAFAAGTVHVMELSEIIERFDLDKKEIDHLRKGVRELSLFSPRESNFENPTVSGWDSIKYDTYSPFIVQQRLLVESMLKENVDPLNDFLGLSSNVNTFGNKYVVVQGYWCSKKKVGKLTFKDAEGVEQTTLVDESYKRIPNEVSIEWNYVNQWYKGYKIGSDVYNVEPFELLDYCPIIGVVHEIKNIQEAKSLIDLLKPYQILYNVCLNQLYKLLEKEVGNVYLGSIRHIPIPKDGDAQDALDIWEQEARKRGMLIIDDSPENLKSPSNFNMFKNIDWTRTAEIQSRYTLAMQLKQEAWELVGISRERTGGIAATQTATGTNTALSQSYAQTEPYFAQHEYVLNDVYQAILDAVQYIEVKKPYSTISYINTEGEQAFIRVNSEDITLKDLQVFVTTRAADQRAFEELKQLAQPMLQNGATPYEISVLYTTNSIRTMKQVFKSLKDKMDQAQQQAQQIQQQELEAQQAQFAAQIQEAQEQDEINKQFEAGQNELDRLNKKEIALIAAAAKERSGYAPEPNAGDENIMEAQKLAQQGMIKDREYQLKLSQIQQKAKESNDYVAMELKKVALDRERIEAQLKMKQMDIKAKKAQAKAKPKPKSK